MLHIMCGISDSHNIISDAMKGDAPPPKHRKMKYRSFKNFDEDAFSEAVGVARFEVVYVFDDVNDIYRAHEVLLTDLLDEHAPIKEKRLQSQQCPFINSNIRKAAYEKAMLSNTFYKWKTPAKWEAYRKQRNLTTKLKRRSIITYVDERCTRGPTSKDFCPTVKPFFLSNRGFLKDPGIILSENNNIISDQTSVSNILNNFFCTCSQRHRYTFNLRWCNFPSKLSTNNFYHSNSHSFRFQTGYAWKYSSPYHKM